MIPKPSDVSTLAPLADALDAASHEERVKWMRSLGRAELVKVWQLAAGNHLDIAHFHGDEGEVVIHEGRNSLPAFNDFQKRFVLLKGKVQGYNHQSNAWFTGPGHFTKFAVGPDDPRAAGHEVVIDYVNHPTENHPDFPPLKHNMSGFSRFVYGGTQDWCRRVSKHVVIGEARRKEKPIGAYFLLVRP